jgi:hypothetical protein
MKPFISTKFYGVINYAAALLLLTSPWFLEYYKFGGAALFLPLLIGWLQLIMAIFSNNNHGFIKVFPMQMHLFLDVITGSFLMCSPFVFGFTDKVFWPQVLLGGLIFFAGVFTKGSPFTSKHYTLAEGQLTSTDSEEQSLMN